MFSEKDLRSLLETSTEGQVLSVYLNTDPTEIQAEAAKIQLRNLLKTVNLPEDVQVVEHFINFEYDWAAKGLVVFTNQNANFSVHSSLACLYPISYWLLNSQCCAH